MAVRSPGQERAGPISVTSEGFGAKDDLVIENQPGSLPSAVSGEGKQLPYTSGPLVCTGLCWRLLTPPAPSAERGCRTPQSAPMS